LLTLERLWGTGNRGLDCEWDFFLLVYNFEQFRAGKGDSF
jgi:hypothetical protein